MTEIIRALEPLANTAVGDARVCLRRRFMKLINKGVRDEVESNLSRQKSY